MTAAPSQGQRRKSRVFPRSSVGVSEPTLERCISCVNVTGRFWGVLVFNPYLSYEFAGQVLRVTFLFEKKRHAIPLLVANYPHMNFTQMHEKLRLELLRRINRGTLSVSLLARQTGFGQAHLSNFPHNRRQLSLEALDRVMFAQHLEADDLLTIVRHPTGDGLEVGVHQVPILSFASGLFDPYIRPAVVDSMLELPQGFLENLQSRPFKPRRGWQRFVALRISENEARPMQPLLWPHAIAVIDRHYGSLLPFRNDRPNVFAVRVGVHIVLRHVDFLANRLVLRPYDRGFPVELMELQPNTTPGDVIAGRVALVLSEM